MVRFQEQISHKLMVKTRPAHQKNHLPLNSPWLVSLTWAMLSVSAHAVNIFFSFSEKIMIKLLLVCIFQGFGKCSLTMCTCNHEQGCPYTFIMCKYVP